MLGANSVSGCVFYKAWPEEDLGSSSEDDDEDDDGGENMPQQGYGYGPEQGYGMRQGYGMQQGYGMHQGYGVQQGYDMQQGHGVQQGYDMQSAFAEQRPGSLGMPELPPSGEAHGEEAPKGDMPQPQQSQQPHQL